MKLAWGLLSIEVARLEQHYHGTGPGAAGIARNPGVALREVGMGGYGAEITVGDSGEEFFHVLGDEDSSQVYYPALPRCTRKAGGSGTQHSARSILRSRIDDAAARAPIRCGPLSVTLRFEDKSAVFGWAAGAPARDFGEQLRAAVRHLTGAATLNDMQILTDTEPPVGVTPRDVFERRYPEAPAFRIVGPKTAKPAKALLAKPGPPAPSRLQAPQRATGKFQKAGGSQLQFLHMLEGNKNPKAQVEPASLTPEEVARHRTAGDCWTIFQNKVYDITAYVDFHPGGKRQIMQGAGKDMTELFQKAHPWVSAGLGAK
ncbi:unnamed protein product [Effrenium voratum]|uniref:Cytochrome b5 heme-binding domain-containing protein n=1 Tax=Effrenium voratum TaxID=2562239 RepID=A0AA36MV47_9DINO|nr:unnamed protein product [Effrenium voratum]